MAPRKESELALSPSSASLKYRFLLFAPLADCFCSPIASVEEPRVPGRFDGHNRPVLRGRRPCNSGCFRLGRRPSFGAIGWFICWADASALPPRYRAVFTPAVTCHSPSNSQCVDWGSDRSRASSSLDAEPSLLSFPGLPLPPAASSTRRLPLPGGFLYPATPYTRRLRLLR